MDPNPTYVRDLRPATAFLPSLSGKAFQKQSSHLLRLLLPHPMSGVLDQVRPTPSSTGSGLHSLKRTGRVVDSPVALTGVGPGNGLFELVQRRASKTRSWDIDWKPERLSASFHGRDLFAPVAAMLARG